MLSFHHSGQLERKDKRNTLMILRYIFIFLGLFLSNELGAQNQCGIDVSRHQGRIEWQKVPKKLRFHCNILVCFKVIV